MMPPQAMKGMANDTPVSRCCRSFCSFSSMGPLRSCAILLESVFTCNVVAIFFFVHHHRRVHLASLMPAGSEISANLGAAIRSSQVSNHLLVRLESVSAAKARVPFDSGHDQKSCP